MGGGIISALANDGLIFRKEPGFRIAKDTANDRHIAFAPEIVRIPDGSYVMYYAGYASAGETHILQATSKDGLCWRKNPQPIISPGGSAWDTAKCSEMSVYKLPVQEGGIPRFRMVYEGCDGTVADMRGVRRIVSAVSES